MTDGQFDHLATSNRSSGFVLRRRGSTSSFLIACLIILILVAIGLWLTPRFARQVVDESRLQTSNLQKSLEDSVRQGMEEAALEDQDPELDQTPIQDEEPIATTSQGNDIAEWSRLVTNFLAQEFLTGSKDEDGNPRTMSETLDRASDRLEQIDPYPPAVEAAIRTLLALSYRDQDRLELAAAQAEAASELLRRTYGELHPYSLQAQRNFGALRLQQLRFDEAVLIYQSLAEWRQVVLGSDDPLTEEAQGVVRLLRLHESDLITNPDRESLPNEIRQLLDNPPDGGRFQALEF